MRTLYKVLIAAMLLLALVPAGSAQDGRLPAPADPELYDRVRNGGRIPVIVRLDVSDYTRESLLSTPDARAQRARLAAIRHGMIARWGRGSGIRVFAGSETWMIPYMALWVNERGLRRLESTPGILSIVEDAPSYPSLISSVGTLDAYEAYNLGFTGLNQTVAILDTGINASHPLLAERIVGERCESAHFPASGLTTLCPNGSGTQIGKGSAASSKCAGIDRCDHGTYTTGIVAGAPYSLNGETLIGIGYGAKVLAVQVFVRSTNASDCLAQPTPCIVAFSSIQVTALQHVYDSRGSYNLAAVLLGFNGPIAAQPSDCTKESESDTAVDPRLEIINTLYDVGIATIVPSGNNGDFDSIASPACVPEAVAVGSTNDARAVSPFSNSVSGGILDLLAVGENVFSASGSIGIVEESGTSAAAAHVAGAWAILKQARPDASVAMILDALQSTGIGVLDGRNGVTTPFIQIGEAIKVLRAAPPAVNILPNPGFESNLDWKAKGAGAKRVCDAAKVLSGLCAAQLKSNGVANSFKQKIENLAPTEGDYAWFAANVSTHGAKGTITAKFVGNGGHKLKLKLNVTGKGTYHMLSMSGPLRVQTYDVTITLTINATAGGSYEADDLTMAIVGSADGLP